MKIVELAGIGLGGLSMTETMSHKQNVARDSFIEIAGVKQLAPTPKYSRTEAKVIRYAALTPPRQGFALPDGESYSRSKLLLDLGEKGPYTFYSTT